MKVKFFSHKIDQQNIETILLKNPTWIIDNNDFELLIVLGGDGTFLEALKLYQHLNINIILINIGNLGFLAKFNLNQYIKNNENYKWQNFYLLELNSKEKKEYAINDMVLNTIDNPQTISLNINGNPWYTYRGSGFIVNTKNGSTGLNRSINGPLLLSDNLYVFHELNPVKSKFDSFLGQSIVLDESKILECDFNSKQLFQLKIDGKTQNIELHNCKIKLIISKAKVIYIDLVNYLLKIKEKLIG